MSDGSVISIHAPLTGSDPTDILQSDTIWDFNPRSPYGERLISAIFSSFMISFQSTLPLRGATTRRGTAGGNKKFQSTLPLRGATQYSRPRKGNPPYFNPRSPYGERLYFPVLRLLWTGFQSTLPLRGATVGIDIFCCLFTYFNPRSPYGERLDMAKATYSCKRFQSTLPLRCLLYTSDAADE